MFFRQLFEKVSCTYTYILADPSSLEAIIIDPVIDESARDLALIDEWGLKLRYVLETHVHADHITGADRLRKATGAKVGVGEASAVECADFWLKDGDVIKCGELSVKALSTPGHTDACTSFLCGDRVFTGDCLLIRGCGRTDFQQGSPEKLYHSIHEKIWKLPPETRVYPAHDYRGIPHSTVGEERHHNKRLRDGIDLTQFCEIMNNLNLPHPKQIHEAVPGNQRCGDVGG